MGNIKVYLIGLVALIILALSGYSWFTTKRIREYNAKYTTELANRKALEAENDSLSSNSELLKLSMYDIKTSNDSLMREIYKAKKELKIKDKNITQLQYMLSEAKRADTLIVRDTLFASPDIKIDTTIGDRWMNTRLKLEYPSTIEVYPSVVSEKYVIMNEVKRTIDKPSRIFFIRWFQKKYTTVDIGIVERNPWIHSTQNRFIEVVK